MSFFGSQPTLGYHLSVMPFSDGGGLHVIELRAHERLALSFPARQMYLVMLLEG